MGRKKILKQIGVSFKNLSLGTKLAFSFILVVVAVGLTSSLIGIRLVATDVVKRAQQKVQIDLNSAWMVYNERLRDIESVVRLTSERFFLKEGFALGNVDLLKRELERIRITYNLDVLSLTDNNGRVLVRTRSPYTVGDDQSNDEMVEIALREKTVAKGTQIVSQEELSKEGRVLMDQAFMVFITTPKAKPRVKDQETAGMMLKVAAPVFDAERKLLGVLYGGHLLNRDYLIVDRIKDIVYQGVKYKGKDIGTATIFQWDVRISTNVKMSEGLRAIGTRVSSDVYEKVLENGEPFIGRAYVVNADYITAYDPIKNVRGEVIGMLYVGILEAPYIDKRNELVLSFFLVAILGIILAQLMVVFVTSRITKPLKGLVFATERIAQGDLDYEVPVASADELGNLATSFNKMTKTLKSSDEEIQKRSSALERANQELRETQVQLIQTEKLSSLGRLAAGVAHELNNPLTGVMTFSHLLLKNAQDEATKRDLEIIIRETTRCREIIKGVLDFARQNPPQRKLCYINGVIEKTLSLLQHQAVFHNITIERKLNELLPQIWIDENQIEQVVMNIALNAAEAMNGQGILSVSSGVSQGGDFVEVRVSDTGMGIPQENLSKIFDPFFTTKDPQRGTGLGLSVSYGIIQKHHGDIIVESEVGKGTTFTVRLPVEKRGN
jgi:two-component system NtrC family sensor kinase